jgi:hypothetical protein
MQLKPVLAACFCDKRQSTLCSCIPARVVVPKAGHELREALEQVSHPLFGSQLQIQFVEVEVYRSIVFGHLGTPRCDVPT